MASLDEVVVTPNDHGDTNSTANTAIELSSPAPPPSIAAASAASAPSSSEAPPSYADTVTGAPTVKSSEAKDSSSATPASSSSSSAAAAAPVEPVVPRPRDWTATETTGPCAGKGDGIGGTCRYKGQASTAYRCSSCYREFTGAPKPASIFDAAPTVDPWARSAGRPAPGAAAAEAEEAAAALKAGRDQRDRDAGREPAAPRSEAEAASAMRRMRGGGYGAGRNQISCSTESITAFWFFYSINAFLIGCYFGFSYAVKSTLWLAGGFAFFFAFALLFLGAKLGNAGKMGALGGFLLVVVYVAGTVAGLVGGHYFQTYWYYRDITVYDGVDAANAYGLGGNAKYNFVNGTRVGQQYGGYIEWIDNSNKYYSVTHQVCVAPVLPAEGTYTVPLDVRFWVVGEDCCGSSATVSACAGANGWNDPTLFAATLRDDVLKSGDAISTAVSLYYLNATAGISSGRRFTSSKPVYVDWTTAAELDAKTANNLLYGRLMIALHLALWPLWTAPVVALFLCGRCCKWI